MEGNRNIKVLLVDNDSMCPDIIVGLMNSMFQVVTVTHPYHALGTLPTVGGFDFVISDVHKPDMDGFQLQQIIAQLFQLPVVCFKCIYAVMCDEKQEGSFGLGMQNGILRKPVSDLIHQWQFITAKKKCKGKSKMDWTDELHSKFADIVESLGGIRNAKPKEIWKLMVKDVPGLTIKNISSHLQQQVNGDTSFGSQQHQTFPENFNQPCYFPTQVVPPMALAPQQMMNYNLESVVTSQQSLNQQHNSSQTQLDGDNNNFDDEEKLEMMMADELAHLLDDEEFVRSFLA